MILYVFSLFLILFFFFQAEDGIRDVAVTGVQTCALPISSGTISTRSPIEIVPEVMFSSPASMRSSVDLPQPDGPTSTTNSPSSIGIVTRSEERRVGKECRSRREASQNRKKIDVTSV